MYKVTYISYGCPSWGGQEYYEEQNYYLSWPKAEAFIQSLEDFEFVSATFEIEEEIPF